VRGAHEAAQILSEALTRAIRPRHLVDQAALPTILHEDPTQALQVTYCAGRVEQQPMAMLAELVSETSNPDNRLGIAQVVVHTPTGLQERVELIDTPGGRIGVRAVSNRLPVIDDLDRLPPN
jgi:hypothetical protein